MLRASLIEYSKAFEWETSKRDSFRLSSQKLQTRATRWLMNEAQFLSIVGNVDILSTLQFL